MSLVRVAWLVPAPAAPARCHAVPKRLIASVIVAAMVLALSGIVLSIIG
jgi:hypothetical protein